MNKGLSLKPTEHGKHLQAMMRRATPMSFRAQIIWIYVTLHKAKGLKMLMPVAEGIRSVIKGDVEEFLYDYPCHTPTEQHWFYMRAIRMEGEPPMRVVVSHEDITQLKLTEEALKKSKQNIEEQKQSLEEANIALKVLLKQRENDKAELEQKVLGNIKNLIFPYLEKLKRAPLKTKHKTTV